MSSWKDSLLNLGIASDLANIAAEGMEATAGLREQIRQNASVNQWKVLQVLQEVGLMEGHFFPTTGYGFSDSGRDVLDEAISMSDRVIVMSAGPGSHPIGEFTIDLPRPRDVAEVRVTPRFIELHTAIWSVLREEVLRGYRRQLQA